MEQEPIWTIGDLAWAYKVKAESALAQENTAAYLIYNQLKRAFDGIVREKHLSREHILQRFLKKLETGRWPLPEQAREQATPIIQEAITDIKSLLAILSSENLPDANAAPPREPRIQGGPAGIVYALTHPDLSQEDQDLAARAAAEELEIQTEDVDDFLQEWLHGYRLAKRA